MLKRLILLLILLTNIVLATTPTNTNLTRLYIAYFDRAPDAKGLKYWVEDSGLYLEEIATSFSEQPEFKKKYPVGYTNEDFINTIYKNLFNRTPDREGMKYWKHVLDDGRIERSLFILAVTNGATGDDEKIMDNKTIVGLAFANAGATNVDQAYTLMQNVTADKDSIIPLICNPKEEYCDSFYLDIDIDTNTTTDSNTTTTDSNTTTTETTSKVPPVISDVSGNVLKNASAGTIVSRISIKSRGDSDITSMKLSGTGSDNFDISIGGLVTLATGATLSLSSYNLDVVATNGAGDSNTVELSILVTDVATDLPVVSNFSKSVAESIAVGSKIGDIIISSTDSPIISITLDGVGSDTFDVATNGAITLKTALDYEVKSLYSLTVVARNSAGVSNIATVDINVTNILDEKAILADYTTTIAENIAIDSIITNKITITDSGDSNITAITLSGDGSDKFSVDTTGTITIKSALDFETKEVYNLKAVATNGAGDSTESAVTITITNIVESAPILVTPSSSNIVEDTVDNSSLAREVVVIVADNSSEPIDSFTIVSGDDNGDFLISNDGNITTAKLLNYEVIPNYTLVVKATNSQGDSDNIDVVIDVTNIIELVPTLSLVDKIFVEQSIDIGTAIATITTDTTTGDSSIVDTYRIESGNDSGDLAIDSTTGVLSIAEALSSPPYTLSIIANNTKGDSLPITVEIATIDHHVKKTGQTKSYAEDGTEVTDGSLKDDGNYTKGVTPNYTRDDTKKIVTDNLTGLKWEDNASVQKQWLTTVNYDSCSADNSSSACNDTTGDTATSYCTALTLGGYNDWRLPTVEELMMIADRSKDTSPSIDTVFQTNQSGYYWTSTTYLSAKEKAWRVSFSKGKDDRVAKSDEIYIRCVRD